MRDIFSVCDPEAELPDSIGLRHIQLQDLEASAG